MKWKGGLITKLMKSRHAVNPRGNFYRPEYLKSLKFILSTRKKRYEKSDFSNIGFILFTFDAANYREPLVESGRKTSDRTVRAVRVSHKNKNKI